MTAPIITREQSGLRPPTQISYAFTPTSNTAHYWGDAVWGGKPVDQWLHSRCASIWRAGQAFHMDGHGWNDIAYTGGICPHGFILEGRWLGVRTAANGTNPGNKTSYAWVYLGGAGEHLTDVAKSAFLDAFALAHAGSTKHPHDYWHATQCPGDELRDWILAGAPDPGIIWNPPPTGPIPTLGNVVALMPTPTGGGYAEVDEGGGVYTFGDAMFWGSIPGLGITPNKPIVAGAYSPSGGGYWLVGADGGVFAFGDARYLGGLGGVTLNRPVRDFDALASGDGYRLIAEDGGVFTFGTATFHGSVVA